MAPFLAVKAVGMYYLRHSLPPVAASYSDPRNQVKTALVLEAIVERDFAVPVAAAAAALEGHFEAFVVAAEGLVIVGCLLAAPGMDLSVATQTATYFPAVQAD